MPLSEEEMRLLEQMERALVAEDPKLASTMRGKNQAAASRRRIILAVVLFLAGVAVLMTGAVLRQTFVGVAGFVTMLGSAYFGLMAYRRPATPQTTQHPSGFGVIDGGKQKRSKGPGMTARFEERWRRRRENGGF